MITALNRYARIGAMVCSLSALVFTGTAAAQDYPSRPVTMLVGTSAGGPTDAMARSLALHLQRHLKQTVVVENRDGASGMIANGAVARAPADGYTLQLGTTSSNVLAPMLVTDAKSDTSKLAPVALVGSTPMVLFINNALPVQSPADLVKLMKKSPGTYAYASSGIGSTSNVAGELFKWRAGVDVLHIPYKGGSALNQSVVAGDTQIGINTLGAVLALHKAGKVRILMVLGNERSSLAPELPTASEAGVPGVDAVINFYLMANTDTLAAIVQRLNGAVAEIIKDPKFIQEMQAAQVGIYPHKTGPEARSAFDAETALWSDVVRRAKVSVR
jgi:tripartite-type tricarboxylate transporter receptor subunit TctC